MSLYWGFPSSCLSFHKLLQQATLRKRRKGVKSLYHRLSTFPKLQSKPLLLPCRTLCLFRFLHVWLLHVRLKKVGLQFWRVGVLVVTRLLFRDGIHLIGLPASPRSSSSTPICPFYLAGQPFQRFHETSSAT